MLGDFRVSETGTVINELTAPVSFSKNDQRVLHTLWLFRISLSLSHCSKYSLIQLCLSRRAAFSERMRRRMAQSI